MYRDIICIGERFRYRFLVYVVYRLQVSYMLLPHLGPTFQVVLQHSNVGYPSWCSFLCSFASRALSCPNCVSFGTILLYHFELVVIVVLLWNQPLPCASLCPSCRKYIFMNSSGSWTFPHLLKSSLIRLLKYCSAFPDSCIVALNSLIYGLITVEWAQLIRIYFMP